MCYKTKENQAKPRHWMVEKKHKNAISRKSQCFFYFIPSIQFLMPWGWMKMDNGHNVLKSFSVQVGTKSFRVVERFICSP